MWRENALTLPTKLGTLKGKLFRYKYMWKKNQVLWSSNVSKILIFNSYVLPTLCYSMAVAQGAALSCVSLA